jgi:hypothetical protein
LVWLGSVWSVFRVLFFSLVWGSRVVCVGSLFFGGVSCLLFADGVLDSFYGIFVRAYMWEFVGDACPTRLRIFWAYSSGRLGSPFSLAGPA